jgi:hypothetical protein
MTTGIVEVACLSAPQRYPAGHDHVHLETDQLGGQTGDTLLLGFGPAWLSHEIPSIDVAELAYAAQERLDGRGGLGSGHVGSVTTENQPEAGDLS